MVIENSAASEDTEETNTSPTVDAAEEQNDPGSHPTSQYVAVATPFHTPITSHHTPREEDTSTYSLGHSESNPFEKVLVSYLLRHFKQGPGQWYIPMILKHNRFRH